MIDFFFSVLSSFERIRIIMENFEFFFFLVTLLYYVNDQSKYYSKFLILIIFLIRSISSRISFDLVVFDTSDV